MLRKCRRVCYIYIDTRELTHHETHSSGPYRSIVPDFRHVAKQEAENAGALIHDLRKVELSEGSEKQTWDLCKKWVGLNLGSSAHGAHSKPFLRMALASASAIALALDPA